MTTDFIGLSAKCQISKSSGIYTTIPNYWRDKMKDVLKKCNCRCAKIENGGRDSVTFWIECKLEGIVTDIERCKKCKKKKEN